MTARVFTWDWKCQPDMADIATAVTELSGGRVFMREIETGSSDYAWVVSDAELTDEQAWRLYLGEDEPAMFPDKDDAVFDERPTGAAFEALYAPGRRVRFEHPDDGYPADRQMAAALLTPGEVYTIEWSDVGFTSTRLGLAGVEDRGQGFNSVLFESVDDQEAAPAAAGEEE